MVSRDEDDVEAPSSFQSKRDIIKNLFLEGLNNV